MPRWWASSCSTVIRTSASSSPGPGSPPRAAGGRARSGSGRGEVGAVLGARHALVQAVHRVPRLEAVLAELLGRRLVLDDDRDLARAPPGTARGSRRARGPRAARTRRARAADRARSTMASRAGASAIAAIVATAGTIRRVKVVQTDRHRAHDPKVETYLGVPVPANEVPERAEMIRAALAADGGFELVEPTEHGEDADPRRPRPGPAPVPRGGLAGGRARSAIDREFLVADTYPIARACSRA